MDVLEQSADFIGKEALARINKEGVTQRLLGAVLEFEKMTSSNEHFWPAFVDDEPAGHLTVCVYSPRLQQNIAFVMVKSEVANAGQSIEIRSPTGSISATLCELPFLKDRKE